MVNNDEWCAVPSNGIRGKRFNNLEWAEKMKGKSWTNQNFTNSPYDNEYLLPSFSEESIPFFHPEGQKKCQSNRLLVWIGWNCKERKIVHVSTWEQEQLPFCILMAVENDQQFCSRLQGHISHYCGLCRRQRTSLQIPQSCLPLRILLSLPFSSFILIAMECAELQMLLLAVFFLIPGVIYSFPSCQNNLFIPFLSPAWDGSHLPPSLWFYHNCLPTYVLCLSYSFPSPESCQAVLPSSRDMVSAQVSLWWINCKPPY